MKSLFKTLIIVLSLGLLLSGCSNSTINECGSLRVTVDEIVTRTIAPSESEVKVVNHKIVLTKGSTVREQEFEGNAVVLTSLTAGNWNGYVIGYSSNGAEVARSETKSVVITQNEDASVSFILSYFSDGRGTMDLKIKIPKADTTVSKVVAEFKPINNAALSDKTLTVERANATETVDERVFHFNGNIETGRYRVKFTMYDSTDSKVGYSLDEILYIYRDKTSSFEWYWDKDYIPPVAPVVFSITSGTYLDGELLELSTTEECASIYYTIDGSTPSSDSILYSSEIALDKNMTIKAIAIKEGLVDSEITEETYKVKVKTPLVALKGGSFKEDKSTTISTETSEASIYYTIDGTTPSKSSYLYSSEVILDKNIKLRAYAVKDGLEPSDVVGEDYTFLCIAPQFSKDSGVYNNDVEVRLSTATKGATVYYSIDGSEPIASSSVYSDTAPIALDKSMTIKAVSMKAGWTSSEVAEREYTMKCSAPVFSIESGSFSEKQTVSLSTSTNDAVIRYTLDETEATEEGILYTSALEIAKDTTIHAIAVKSGYSNSDQAIANYYISPQNTGITIKDPLVTDFRMGMPQGWKSGMYILNTVEKATLFVETSSEYSNVRWFYDGYEKENFQGRDSITVGSASEDIPLELGGHVITLRVAINGVSYTENLYYVVVSSEVDDNFVFWGDLELYGTGPGGGTIIFDIDVGYKNEEQSRKYGWKYIEVAPNDLRLIDGKASISSADSSTTAFVFGYHRDSATGTNKRVNSFTSYFGSGLANTEYLVKAMGDSGYTDTTGTATTSNYAAKLCYDLESHEGLGTIKDWYLPSMDELYYAMKILPIDESFSGQQYWTSTETSESTAYYFDCASNQFKTGYRRDHLAIRPVRIF